MRFGTHLVMKQVEVSVNAFHGLAHFKRSVQRRLIAARLGCGAYREAFRTLSGTGTASKTGTEEDRRHSRSCPKMKLFRNRHSGRRCFVIGNGPSLRRTDLSRLKNEVTFGLNRIYLMYPEMGFETTYLVCVNKLVIDQCADEIAGLTMPKFLSCRSDADISERDDVIYMKTHGTPIEFAFDMTGSVTEGGTVTYVALQLAYYMGFEEVILVGVDHSFSTKGPPNTTVVSEGDDPNHFSPSYFGKGFSWQLPDLYHSELSYRLAGSVYGANGRRILDATVGGKLTVYPKVDYEGLF